MKRSKAHIILLVILLLPGCMKDELIWQGRDSGPGFSSGGIFVVNEGNFMYNNASLSYYDPQSGEVWNDVFFNRNGLGLGDVAHSIQVRDSLAYIVVNNSGRIFVMDTRSFEYLGKITGLTSPRYLHFVDREKAYVSDLYARAIAVVDMEKLEVSTHIHVRNSQSEFYQHATEQMLQYDRYVYVSCWSFDNQILVIDSEQDLLVDSLEVGKQPNSMVMDRSHTLWILSDGGFEGSPYGQENGSLMRIPAGARNAELVHRFAPGDRPTDLVINGTGDTLYFLNRHVYRLAIGQLAPPEKVIDYPSDEATGAFYALAVDPRSSELYVADAMDYIQRGMVYRYSAGAVLRDSFRVGITPGAFGIQP